MAPKGGNAKKEGGRAKKAENEASKKQAAEEAKERAEATKWADGSKGKAKSVEDKEARRQAELARKAENARMLAEEEASAPAKKAAAPKAGAKKAKPTPKPAGPGAIAAGGGLAAVSAKEDNAPPEKQEVESYSATGIDNALDLLEVVTAKMDKASVGSKAGEIEKHPERRFKGALEAYSERELPRLRQEHPGLRLQQYKQFQKSPENPFNQVSVSYDASKEDRVEALKRQQDAVTNRLREK